MVKVKEVIVVEGRYDKNTLSQVVDAVIVETGGFAVFRDRERLELIRAMAKRRGIIVFTDPDGAGFVIRNFLRGAVPPEQVKHAYVPDIKGKEKRKSSPSKEGKLGVEGVPAQVILEALQRAGATCGQEPVACPKRMITKTDLFEAGLSGGENSAQKRRALLKRLKLPEHLAPNALVKVLNSLMGYEEFYKLVQEL